jgi:hypothetical protein
MREEYDVTGTVRGKHAAREAQGTNIVKLDPGVAAVLLDPASMNDVLRLLAKLARQQTERATR